MSNITQQEVTAGGRGCYKVICDDIVTGLVAEIDGKWHFCRDLKGEFWSLQEFSEKDSAVEKLVANRKALDELRVDLLKGKKA